MIDYTRFLASKARTVEQVGPEIDDFTRTTLAVFDAEHGISGPTAYIYGLHDPRTRELRYIGKSVRPRERLQNQINEHPNTHRGHWLDELARLGLRPMQVIIDAVPADTDWQTVERIYIAAAREAGHRLTNGTDGGDGVCGLSPESRARMLAASVGRKASAETRARLRAAMARRGPVSAETRRKRSEALRGIPRTAEWTARLRAASQKLSPGVVLEIRRMIAAGASQYVIADRFGIHQGSVSNIARGITYRSTP